MHWYKIIFYEQGKNILFKIYTYDDIMFYLLLIFTVYLFHKTYFKNCITIFVSFLTHNSHHLYETYKKIYYYFVHNMNIKTNNWLNNFNFTIKMSFKPLLTVNFFLRYIAYTRFSIKIIIYIYMDYTHRCSHLVYSWRRVKNMFYSILS